MNRGGQIKHGLVRTPIYSSWMNMKMRCYNAASNTYCNYGARGIKVCEFIKSSPVNLKAIVGSPTTGLTLNRIDNNGHYSCGVCPECISSKWPLNIEWATRSEQGRNTRRNRMLRFRGQVRCMIEWSELLGINVRTIIARLARGMTDEQALSTTRVRRSFAEARFSQLGRKQK